MVPIGAGLTRKIYLGADGAETGGPSSSRERQADLARSTVSISPQGRSSSGSRSPLHPTGMVFCSGILPSADGRSYVYSVNRSLASLIVAEGLR